MNTLLKSFLGAVLVCVSLNAQAILLSLVPDSQNVPVGSTVAVDLMVSGLGDHTAPSLGAFDVNVNFDSGLFSVNLGNITFGGGLGDPNSAGETSIQVDTGTAGLANLVETSLLEINSTSCVFCTGPYLEDLQGSSFKLATLVFNANNPGTGSFNLSINALADGNAENLVADVQNTRITAFQIATVPEPGTLILFSLGLVGVARFTRLRGAL